MRGVDARFNKATMGEVVNVFYLLGTLDNKYDSILSHSAAGDATAIYVNLAQLKA